MRKFIPVAEPSITDREAAYVADAVRSGWVSSLGEYIVAFEKRFAEFVGAKHALTTTSGTTALHLALVTLGIGEGDEVIVPDLTFVATANAVAYTGARPVFIDVDPECWCIDPEGVIKAITGRTKAILPVHIYGHPADMGTIMDIAKKHSLHVIEDAAEAHGAEYRGLKVGALGDVGIFSFYGNKIMTTGEGGMITTKEDRIYERAKYLRDHAMSGDKRYWHTEVGFNYRMTNMQAAMGLAQLERVEEFIGKKRETYRWYSEGLSDVSGVRLNPEMEWGKSVFWMVSLVLEKSAEGGRDAFMAKLRKEGIDSRPFFYPMTSLPMFGGGSRNPVARHLSKRGVNLPSGVELTRDEVAYICRKVKEFLVTAR